MEKKSASIMQETSVVSVVAPVKKACRRRVKAVIANERGENNILTDYAKRTSKTIAGQRLAEVERFFVSNYISIASI